jgi:hypothetical protein
LGIARLPGLYRSSSDIPHDDSLQGILGNVEMALVAEDRPEQWCGHLQAATKLTDDAAPGGDVRPSHSHGHQPTASVRFAKDCVRGLVPVSEVGPWEGTL